MAINSLPFFWFFAIVFALYYVPITTKKKDYQNVLLLIASYFFYGYTDLLMLPLIVVVTVMFYFLGRGIEKYEDTKVADRLLLSGVVIGVGMLVYLKYTNFFIQSISALLNSCGLHTSWHSLKVIVPLGISFFVFRLISYLIEVHRGMMTATRDFISFATFVSFFPCMLSGPIDRPNVFIPQLEIGRSFRYETAVDGLRQILWGIFKKMVIADNLAKFVDLYFSSGEFVSSGSTTIVAAIAYTFQIYADFSGYSDMAIGVGKLLNLKVAKNFNNPFFALNIADFWRRWHMSLTTWVTDYVFTPLCFNFRNMRQWGMILAIIINFLIVGLWHGASWNYVIYGFYHGLLFVPLILLGKMNVPSNIQTNKLGLPRILDLCRMLLTFSLVVFGMLIFRCTTIDQFLGEVGTLKHGLLSVPEIGELKYWLFVIVMMFVEWWNRNNDHGLDLTAVRAKSIRWFAYIVILVLIFLNGGQATSFIYQVF